MKHDAGHRVRSALSTLAVASIALLAAPTRPRACSCAPPPPPARAADGADVVFEGITRNVSVHPGAGQMQAGYEFAVARVFKGQTTATTRVYSPSSSASCGIDFVVGHSYVVYAVAGAITQAGYLRIPGAPLHSTLCSRTGPSSAAADDIAALGPGYPPNPGGPVDGGTVEAGTAPARGDGGSATAQDAAVPAPPTARPAAGPGCTTARQPPAIRRRRRCGWRCSP